MSLSHLPDESWVRVYLACKSLGVSQRTAQYWRDRGHVRSRQDSRVVEVHLGDFRRMARDLGRKQEKKSAEDAVVRMFEQPLRPGECAHIECAEPRDPGSWLFMCQGHQFLADSRVPA